MGACHTKRKQKSLAQKVRQKSYFGTFHAPQPFICARHDRWMAIRPVLGNLTRKMNITFFITN